MTTVIIDLAEVLTTSDLLARIGDVLEFGGPGDLTGTNPTSGRGWGRNWDALADCLCYVDSGGIWGTSRPLKFPLSLRFENSSGIQAAEPASVRTLIEVLEDAATKYAKTGFIFNFELC